MSQEHRRGIVPVVLLAAMLVLFAYPVASFAADQEGTWLGKVKDANNKDVEITLTVEHAGSEWHATLTDKTLGDVKLTHVQVRDTILSFKFQPEGVPYPATFAGTYDVQHDRLSGTFSVRGTSRFVKFKRTAGGDMTATEEEPKEPVRVRHDYRFGINGRIARWVSLHVTKDEAANLNAATSSTTNFDTAAKFYVQDGFCLFGRYYRGGQNFTDDPTVLSQWPNLGLSSSSYIKLDGWDIGLMGFFGNKFFKTSAFNPYLTGSVGHVSWELNQDGRGSNILALGLRPVEGTDLALSGGLGTEYEISQKLQLEIELVWRFFMTEDNKIWPDIDQDWSNTHVWQISFGATYGLF